MFLCMLMPCLMMADDIKTYNFPKEKGPVIYGATMKDELGPLHYVMFHTNDAKVTKLGRIDEEDNGTHMRNLRCGAYCDGKYYGYLINMYTYVEEPKAFGTVDFNTGEFTVLFDEYTKADRVSWPTLYEMAYDNTNKICYALGRNMDGLFVSDLYKINLNDGSYEMLATLDFYAWAMACDYEGNIYMIKGVSDKNNEFYEASSIVRIDANDGYKEKDEVRITVEGKDYIPNYTHTMDFDHDTNQLYWLGMSNEGWQKVFNLDIHTGKAVETANMFYNIVSGVFIPFDGADNRGAAGMVTNLKGEPASDGSMQATLEWVTPTTNWKGDNLETISSVTIAKNKRDNIIAKLATIEGKGAKMSYTDKNAQKGYNVYYVRTHRFDGENGLIDSCRVFVGPDAPGYPENVVATAEGKNVRITWQAPSTGAHGEKYDANTTVYDITRMPDNVVIATNIKETSFLDEKIGSKKQYTYVVKAMNDEGEGLSTESAPILAGNAYALPFDEQFDSDLCKTMWTSLDANYDGIAFEWAGGVVEDFFRYQIWLNNQHDTNDYMITPPLATKKGAQYRVNYDVQIGRMEDLHKFVIVTGSDATLEGMTNRVDSVENLKCENYDQIMSFESKFIADAEDTYVGLQCMSAMSSTGSYFAVRRFHVEEIFAKDLAVLSITGAKDFVKDQSAEMIVTVKNMGYETINNYKVEVISRDAEGNITVLGTTDVNEALAVDNTIDIKVEAIATVEGEIEIAARVVVEGDMNNANDICAWNKYVVNPAGTSDWNIIVEAGTATQSTTEPMNFYNIYSTTESIYLKDEIKAEKDGKITRIAYQYSDNSLTAETEEFDVKIYMANTNKEGFEAQVYAEDWTPLDEMTLVCEKTLTVKPGQDNLMVFDLDTPFDYDHTKNLCIQVWKEGALESMFPALFKVYNFGWDVYRALRYNTNKIPFDYEDSNYFFPVNNVPVLHMAIDYDGGNSGIIEINGGNSIVYNNGVLAIMNGTMNKIIVTDVTGKMIYNDNVNAPSVNLNLNSGLYIIKVIDGEGNAHIVKVVGK